MIYYGTLYKNNAQPLFCRTRRYGDYGRTMSYKPFIMIRLEASIASDGGCLATT